MDVLEQRAEADRLEQEVIDFWVHNNGQLPQAAFIALMSSAKIACDPGRMTETEIAAADRALVRLRDAAEAVRS